METSEPASRAWTEAEDDRLRREYPLALDTAALAVAMGRSRAAVQVRACALGLKKLRCVRGEINSGNRLDDDELQPRLEIVPASEPGIVRVLRHRCR